MCQFTSVQLISHVRLFVTPRTAAPQASLSITNSRSLLKLMCIELVMPSNHLILCCPLLLLPSIFPSITVFPKESVLRIRWPKYWSFNLSISPSNECSVLIFFNNVYVWENTNIGAAAQGWSSMHVIKSFSDSVSSPLWALIFLISKMEPVRAILDQRDVKTP